MLSIRSSLGMTTALLLGAWPLFAEETIKPENSAPIATQLVDESKSGTDGQIRPKAPRKPSPEEDLSAIRQMLEEQALKLEAINQQISKLLQKSSSNENPQAGAPKLSEPPTPPAVPFSASPAASPGSPLTSGSNPIHVVAKGETLTSIARHSKVTVAELLKLNKIENDRALQIGQTLILPAPKPVETPVNNEPK